MFWSIDPGILSDLLILDRPQWPTLNSHFVPSLAGKNLYCIEHRHKFLINILPAQYNHVFLIWRPVSIRLEEIGLYDCDGYHHMGSGILGQAVVNKHCSLLRPQSKDCTIAAEAKRPQHPETLPAPAHVKWIVAPWRHKLWSLPFRLFMAMFSMPKKYRTILIVTSVKFKIQDLSGCKGY